MASEAPRMDMATFNKLNKLIQNVEQINEDTVMQALAWSRRGLGTVFKTLTDGERAVPFKWSLPDRLLMEAVKDHLVYLIQKCFDNDRQPRPILVKLAKGAMHLLENNIVVSFLLQPPVYFRDEEHKLGGKRESSKKSGARRGSKKRLASKSKPRRRSTSRRRR